MNNELIGSWKSDPDDEITQRNYGSVIMEFKENGILVYRIFDGGKEQIIKLTYEIKNNTILTNQPSSYKKEISEFTIIKNKMILDFEGIRSTYVKID
jgi:hypothetical protein